MRAELHDTHTGGAASSALSKMTGIVQHQTYDNLKKAMHDKIRKAYTSLRIPPPNNSQLNTKFLEDSLDQLVESVLKQYKKYGEEMEEVRQRLLGQKEEQLKDFLARRKHQNDVFGEEVLKLRGVHDEEIEKLRAAHTDEIQNLQDQLRESMEPSEPPENTAKFVPDMSVTPCKYKKENECVVCLDNIKTQTLLPCRHKACCATCAQSLKQCPLCRKEVTDQARIVLVETEPTGHHAELKQKDEESDKITVYKVYEQGLISGTNQQVLKEVRASLLRNLVELRDRDTEKIIFSKKIPHAALTISAPPPRPTRREYTVRVPGL